MNHVILNSAQTPDAMGSREAPLSGDLFRLVLENAAVGMALLSPEGSFLAVNPALCRMLGRDATSLQSATWQQLTHPVDLEADSAQMQDLLEGRIDSYRLRKRYLRPDDGVVWGDVSVSCVRGDDGTIRTIITQIVDVSGEVEAERTSREAAEGFRRVADSATAAIVTVGAGCVITGWNRVAEESFGYSREEALGRDVRMLVPDGDAAWREALAGDAHGPLAAGLLSCPTERLARRREGGEFPVEVSLCEWMLSGERCVTSIIRDISDRHQAEAALRDSERRLRSILDTTPDLIALYDLQSRSITTVNRGVERALGHNREALAETGVDLAALLLPPESDQVFQSTSNRLGTLRRGEVLEWDREARSAQGQPIWLWVRATVFDVHADGTAASILLTAMDITGEYRSEQALAASAEHLRLVMDAMLDAHLVHRAVRDEGGHIVDFELVDANPAACAMYRQPFEQLVGRRLLERFPGHEAHEVVRRLAAVVESGEPLLLDGVQSLLNGEDGAPRRIDVRATRFGDGVSETIRDVTERFEAEEALHRRFAEIDALRRISALLAQRIDLATALDSVTELLAGLFDACTVRVRLFPEDEEAEAREHVAGDAQCRPNDPVAEAEAIVSALTSRRLLVARNGADSELLVVPLRAHDDTVGVLAITRSLDSGEFTAGEQALVSTAADLLAAVVRSERLSEVETRQASANERERLARNLHDAVTQSIFSANLMAEVLPAVWEQQPQEAFNDMLVIRRLIKAAFAELRVLLFELRPESLAMAPLETLLERLGEAFAGQSDVAVELAVKDELALPDEVRVAFYRITQEALSNVAKHAGASQVSVNIGRDGDAVRLVVSDDGCGFPRDERAGGTGYAVMRDQAESIGAELEVESSPESGTIVSLVWRGQEAKTEQ